MPISDGSDVSTNQGFNDQQLALQWVQKNIEKFGGDKSKVRWKKTWAPTTTQLYSIKKVRGLRSSV